MAAMPTMALQPRKSPGEMQRQEKGQSPANRRRAAAPAPVLPGDHALAAGCCDRRAGSLNLDVPVADSITTWRVTALASSQDGRLGSPPRPLRVFQDFFIDLDLPAVADGGR